ncbi:L-lysine 2-3-aminomutase [Penicillium paradoxum]|uniref:L-lysine 2-3-aminomutase n=1 Tax=Penicillium paradoxum TaxID=176176 RepID=UPI0025475604|nr:L-lysine 2-3-aminomutase [Penicillium paradoxum]KAJ5794501.1 L-lysine 2-3-aminomutase [Penicillium paradoxum]
MLPLYRSWLTHSYGVNDIVRHSCSKDHFGGRMSLDSKHHLPNWAGWGLTTPPEPRSQKNSALTSSGYFLTVGLPLIGVAIISSAVWCCFTIRRSPERRPSWSSGDWSTQPAYSDPHRLARKSNTYDHRVWKTGLPVRSAVLKPHAGELVVGWVTTSESSLFVASDTYDHRVWKIGLPVRSAVLKPHAGELVVGWVTTSESSLLKWLTTKESRKSGINLH